MRDGIDPRHQRKLGETPMVTTNTAHIAFGSTAAVLALFVGSAQADDEI
ncbi:MAG: hypothetical protein ACRED0_10135 [Gammaproteobacteria bacterium]